MVRVAGTAEVVAIDAAPFVAALPGLPARWRELTFTDGGVRHPVTGRLHEGLRVIDGTHPAPGTVYRLVLRDETIPAPTPEESAVAMRLAGTDPKALDEWERGRLAVARATGRVRIRFREFEVRLLDDGVVVRSTETDAAVRVGLAPGEPVEVVLSLPTVDGHGPVAATVHADLGRLPPYGKDEPQLVGTVTHPRGRATADVGVAPSGTDAWTVTVRVSARGAGWRRLLDPFLRPQLQRTLDDLLAALPAKMAELHRYATRYAAADDLPGRLLADLVSAVPERNP